MVVILLILTLSILQRADVCTYETGTEYGSILIGVASRDHRNPGWYWSSRDASFEHHATSSNTYRHWAGTHGCERSVLASCGILSHRSCQLHLRRPRGRQPRVSDRACLTGILFVLPSPCSTASQYTLQEVVLVPV